MSEYKGYSFYMLEKPEQEGVFLNEKNNEELHGVMLKVKEWLEKNTPVKMDVLHLSTEVPRLP